MKASSIVCLSNHHTEEREDCVAGQYFNRTAGSCSQCSQWPVYRYSNDGYEGECSVCPREGQDQCSEFIA